MKLASTATLKTIVFTALTFFIFRGSSATLGNPQQILSITSFLLIIYFLLALSTVANDAAIKTVFLILSMFAMGAMGSLSIDIAESANATRMAIKITGIYWMWQVCLVHRSNTTPQSPYKNTKSIADAHKNEKN